MCARRKEATAPDAARRNWHAERVSLGEIEGGAQRIKYGLWGVQGVQVQQQQQQQQIAI
jgi:hypothetical protein